MIIYFILLMLACLLLLFRNSNIYTNVFFRYILAFLFVIILFLVYVFRSIRVGTDYLMYHMIFDFSNSLGEQYKNIEVGYRWINNIAQGYNNFNIITIFIFVITLIGFWYLSHIFKINLFSFFSFYIITFLYLFSFNILRQFIAFGIICIGFSIFIKYKNKHIKYIIYFLFVALATLFHSSAIFCILLIFLPNFTFKYTTVIYGMLITAIGYFTSFIKILVNKTLILFPHYVEKYNGNLSNLTFHGNKGIFQFIPILLQFVFLFIYIYYNSKNGFSFKNRTILNGYFVFLLMYSAGGDVAASRLQVYMYMFPLLFACLFVDHVKNKNNYIYIKGTLLKSLFIIFWILYFMLRLFTDNSGVVPYSI